MSKWLKSLKRNKEIFDLILIVYIFYNVVDNDPHFIVHMKGIDTSVCFDIMGIPGDIINLVRDEISGKWVNTYDPYSLCSL